MAYSPTIGGAPTVSFPRQFPHSRIAHISLATTLIEQLSNDGEETVVSHGTGFLWRHNGNIFLVTARHVITGRDPFDDQPMSNMGYIPRRLRIYPMIESGAGTDNWGRTMVILEMMLDDGPAWIQDPEFDTLRTDIAALEVPTPPGVTVRCLNDEPDLTEDIVTYIGMDCAVVGYPQPKVGGLMTPIWRRGTFASEPYLPVDNKPMFLLDAATSPGFSGSPVFRRHIGPAPIQYPDGSMETKLDALITTSFIGVYAGRLRHSHYGGEVPFVFYANRLPFIFNHQS